MSFYNEYPEINKKQVNTELKYYISYTKPAVISGIFLLISIFFFYRAMHEYDLVKSFNSIVLWNIAIAFMFILGIVQKFFTTWLYKRRIAKNEYIKTYGTRKVGEIIKMSSLGRSVYVKIDNNVFTKKINRVQNERSFRPIEWYESNKKYEIACNPENMSDFVILEKITN